MSMEYGFRNKHEKGAESSNSDKLSLLYRLARHLYNPDDIPVHKWAVKGAHLLSQLEEIDPERYKEAMKKTAV